MIQNNEMEIKTLREVEKEYILKILLLKKFNKKETALALGMVPRTLRNKLRSYGINSRDNTEDGKSEIEREYCWYKR